MSDVVACGESPITKNVSAGEFRGVTRLQPTTVVRVQAVARPLMRVEAMLPVTAVKITPARIVLALVTHVSTTSTSAGVSCFATAPSASTFVLTSRNDLRGKQA